MLSISCEQELSGLAGQLSNAARSLDSHGTNLLSFLLESGVLVLKSYSAILFSTGFSQYAEQMDSSWLLKRFICQGSVPQQMPHLDKHQFFDWHVVFSNAGFPSRGLHDNDVI